ncbi:glycosyltransferase [Cognataquiflexum aquatile]|uniref:glycosyltransferase n=1 Tax=Cognataquiflexum aquatile TaxID=2249427 RepID=UPI000DEAA1A4|nr:glycosyltransferase [Cognataquiflexum aquatile]
MAKFLFTQWQNVEMVVKEGKPWGGSAVQTFNWMIAFHELHHAVLLGKRQEDNRELADQFQWVELVPLYDSRKLGGKIAWFFHRFPSIFRMLKKNKPDFIYTSIPNWTTFYIVLMSRYLGIKHIIRIANDPDVNKSMIKDYPKSYEIQINLAYRFADYILAQNNFQYNTLLKIVPPERVLKISNPIVINKTYLNPKKTIAGYIAWIANFRYQKNFSLLYDIAKMFPNEKFKVAGQPLFPLDAETETYFDKLKKLPNVEFVGVISRDEILDFLKEAKFLLNTSRYEGFSNTFLESMLTGTPILTTTQVNPDGIIDNYGLGLVYENQSDLLLKFGQLSQNDYLNLSQNCIAYVKENHDHILQANKLFDFLNISI